MIFCSTRLNIHLYKSNHLSILLFLLSILKIKIIVYSFQAAVPTTRISTVWGGRTSCFNLKDDKLSLNDINLANSTSYPIQYKTSTTKSKRGLPPLANCSRRELFTICQALGIALSQFNQPANAVEEIKSTKTNLPNIISNIPYSSTRQQKAITLSNGLKVLLVNDKTSSQSTVALVMNGAGQFQDPVDLPGLAHLMEHMVLSYNKDGFVSKQPDFEDWLADKGGVSNGFTAFQQTCFYFNAPHDILGRALLRFSNLFQESNIIETCNNQNILSREIQRVDSELDLKTTFAQVEYVTKSFVNFENPYCRFTRGNVASLESIPRIKNIDVSEKLIQFFQKYYLPTQAVLVVVGNTKDLMSLQRYVSITPFSVALSTRKSMPSSSNFNTGFYPGRFLRGNFLKHLVLYSNNDDKDTTKLIIQWVLDEDYRGNKITNAVEIAFVLNQIFGRRGPGSLYLYLKSQGWIQNGNSLPSQITVPVNVSGFQILKLELCLTLEGFLNRNRVVSAVYDSIDVLRRDGFIISREIMAQYATTAKLFGYTLAPRPADAVELAVDIISYGMAKVESGKWYRFPSTEDNIGGLGLNRMRRAVSKALTNMNDPENALIIVTADAKAIDATLCVNGKKNPIPSLSSSRWKTERISGARLYFEEMLPARSRVGQNYLNNIITKEEFLPPIYNPFVLTSLRPPRNNNLDQASLAQDNKYSKNIGNRITWAIITPGKNRIPLPKSPPETNCRCAFILQLLSTRPKTATAEQAARAELWKHSFYAAASDLAELGSPGGLAYEIQFNPCGLRISFLGLSQTIASYARRMMQILVKHQHQLMKGPKMLPDSIVKAALVDANRARGLSPSRKRIVINTIQKASASEVANEATSFLKSVTSVISFSEGDILPSEAESLFIDLRNILEDYVGDDKEKGIEVIPSMEELIDVPVWRPRNASPCYIAGVSLISDACGRILK